jgi:hypothetical protein
MTRVFRWDGEMLQTVVTTLQPVMFTLRQPVTDKSLMDDRTFQTDMPAVS